MTKAVESGMPKLRIEEAAARRQARVDRGDEAIVGVNKYRLDDEPEVDIREVDNTAVREQQLARLAQHARDARRSRPAQAALDRLTRGRRAATATCSSSSIEATRARATVGEISDALEAGVLAAPRRRSARSPACTAAPYEGDEEFAGDPAREVDEFAARRGPPAAHPRRQDGPGRPRPRRQGDRDRVRRPRLRRRRRPAVPDARGGRARRDRERRARRRRVEPGRRAQDARARAHRAAAQAGRRRHRRGVSAA